MVTVDKGHHLSVHEHSNLGSPTDGHYLDWNEQVIVHGSNNEMYCVEYRIGKSNNTRWGWVSSKYIALDNNICIVAGSVKITNTNIGYRYVDQSEYDFIMKNGYIPNTKANGQSKEVYVSTIKYNNAEEAENALQIRSNNPNGPTNSPKYRVEFKLNSVQYDYEGPVKGGTGYELTTKQAIPVDRSNITKLQNTNGNNNSGSGGSGGGYPNQNIIPIVPVDPIPGFPFVLGFPVYA